MHWASSTLLVFSLIAAPAVAQVAGDSLAIRTTIERQWQAFLNDDADAAFSLASPDIRQTFGTADNFMTTVRNDYPMVYRHGVSQFLDEEIHGTFSFQLVRLSDGDGQVWLVVYQMQRQQDGSWLIGGVVAVPRGDVPSTEPPLDST